MITEEQIKLDTENRAAQEAAKGAKEKFLTGVGLPLTEEEMSLLRNAWNAQERMLKSYQGRE